MAVDFASVYRSKSDSELLRLSKEKDSLQPSARIAFDAEMRKRGLQDGDSQGGSWFARRKHWRDVKKHEKKGLVL